MCYKYYIYLTDKVAELSLGDVELSLNLVIQLVVLPQPQSALARQGQTKSTIGLGQPLHGTSERATYGQANTSINYDRLRQIQIYSEVGYCKAYVTSLEHL